MLLSGSWCSLLAMSRGHRYRPCASWKRYGYDTLLCVQWQRLVTFKRPVKSRYVSNMGTFTLKPFTMTYRVRTDIGIVQYYSYLLQFTYIRYAGYLRSVQGLLDREPNVSHQCIGSAIFVAQSQQKCDYRKCGDERCDTDGKTLRPGASDKSNDPTFIE